MRTRYSTKSRVYRVYILSSKCMVESINVIVDDLGSRSRESNEDRIDVSKDTLNWLKKNLKMKIKWKGRKREEQGKKSDRGRIEPSKKNKSRVPKNRPLSHVIRFRGRFLYFVMGVRRRFLYLVNFFLDVDMETWWHVDTWFLGIWHFAEMWMFFYLYVRYSTIELSSLCLFSWI